MLFGSLTLLEVLQFERCCIVLHAGVDASVIFPALFKPDPHPEILVVNGMVNQVSIDSTGLRNVMSPLTFLLASVLVVLGLTIIQALLFAKVFRFLLRGPRTLEKLYVRCLQ